MKLWLILAILSPVAYFVVHRSIKHKTTTPVWLCWLTIMLPSFIWTVWTYIFGEGQPLPLPVFLFPLIICPFLYGWLVQRGKLEENQPKENQQNSTKETTNKPVSMAKPVAESTTTPRPIDSQEETTLRNCFPWNVYYLQNIDYRPQAIFCRGKLKTIPEKAYNEIKNNIEQAFGDRFFLIFQESFRGKPFFALVPNPHAQSTAKESEDLRIGFALIMFVTTLVTTTVAGVSIDGTPFQELLSNPSLLVKGLTYSLPLLLIIAIQKFSNFFVANYYQIRTTLPYFIPFPFLLDSFAVGTLGALSQRRSPIPHRKALFDLAIVGSLAGLLAVAPVLIGGLSLSTVVPLNVDEPTVFDIQALDPRLSLLLSLLAKLTLGADLTTGMGIQLHPLGVAGCVGLLLVAIDLMPIGQLNGGHIVHAVFGQKMAIAVGQVTRIVALLFALVHPYFWIWAIVMWLIPLIDRPALNDVTELDNGRDFLGLAALALLIIIILPVPEAIASLLDM